MSYNHTQTGHLMIFVLFAVVVLFAVILTQTGFETEILIAYAVILLILASFATLNVSIDNEHLRIKFGWGIFRKRFILQNIVSAKMVRNHWYYGWGIRFWAPRRMWVYNVSGFDAIEIKMKNNRIYRIGTDQPEALEEAIIQTIRN